MNHIPEMAANLRIPKDLYQQLIDHAVEDSPNECCGMVASRDGQAVRILRASNAEASPFRYSIDPAQQLKMINEIEADGSDLGAIYHSHTRSPAYPSQTDVNLAFYPDSLYLIVSLEDESSPDLRAFKIRDGQIEEARFEIES